eukprot:COSAG02_NODE_918_length_15945_cov_5.640752_5_plen_167_part_00
MPVAQWLILVMGLSTITPDSASGSNSSDRGDMFANGAGGLSSTGGVFGSGLHSGQTGSTGAVGGSMDASDSSWTDVQVSASNGTDSPGDTAVTTHGPAGMRLPAGKHRRAQPVYQCRSQLRMVHALNTNRLFYRSYSRSAAARRDASWQSRAPTSTLTGSILMWRS